MVDVRQTASAKTDTFLAAAGRLSALEAQLDAIESAFQHNLRLSTPGLWANHGAVFELVIDGTLTRSLTV